MNTEEKLKDSNEELRRMCSFKAPDDFDPKDIDRINMFSKRLREVRKERDKESKRPKDKYFFKYYPQNGQNGYRQEDLADILGVKTMMVSKYENGYDKIKTIPMKHLNRICCFYDVSPYYLLGYVDDELEVFETDKNGDFVCDDNGNPRVLMMPMWFAPIFDVEAFDRYKDLSMDDRRAFEVIDKLVSMKAEKRRIYIDILDALLKR